MSGPDLSGDKVWVLSCPCGWSRMVPRSTPTKRRVQIIEDHKAKSHSKGTDQ